MKRAVAGLISKGLIQKTGQTNGYGKEQGVEYRLPTLSSQLTLSSQPILSSQPNMDPNKLNTIKEHTQKGTAITPAGEEAKTGVRVASKFSLEECRRFAESLRAEGIQNPGGYATTIHRSGEADDRIEAFLRQEYSHGAGKPELNAAQIQEQANLISSLLRDGAGIEELEEKFADNYRPSQWHMIRSMALVQAKVHGAPAQGAVKQ